MVGEEDEYSHEKSFQTFMVFAHANSKEECFTSVTGIRYRILEPLQVGRCHCRRSKEDGTLRNMV